MVVPRQRRPEPDREIALGHSDRLALKVGEPMDAAALAGDDGVGRLVEQHEHGLDRLAARAVAIADQLVDVGERHVALAGGHARDRIGRALGRRDRHGEALVAEQAATGCEHDGRHAAIERTIQRKHDGDGALRLFRTQLRRARQKACRKQSEAKRDEEPLHTHRDAGIELGSAWPQPADVSVS